jgi:hypothetical protein
MNERFGRWIVLQAQGKKSLCRCDCGTERLVIATDLRLGKSTSCGCLRRERTSEGSKIWNRKHGMEKSPEYRIWVDMKRRCHQPQRSDYHRYGGRGIAVCDEWRFGNGHLSGFECFYRDVGLRPSPKHTLDRNDNDGPYCKDNCEWVLRAVQARNTRTNHFVEVDGERMLLVEAAERYGIKYGTLKNRVITLGWPIDRAINEPIHPR